MDPPELELEGVVNLLRALGTDTMGLVARAASALNLYNIALIQL